MTLLKIDGYSWEIQLRLSDEARDFHLLNSIAFPGDYIKIKIQVGKSEL